MTYHSTPDRIATAVRPGDRLYVRDNTAENIGFAAGANAAARQGRGELILFANPDGDFRPGALDALEEVLMRDPATVAVQATLGDDAGYPLDREWLSGACLVVRRVAFEQVGGFDERLFMYAEDVDLSYKLKPLGRLQCVPGARFDHDPGGRSFSASHRNFRNWLVVQRRHRQASPKRMLRDAFCALRQRRVKDGCARVTGTMDYLIRARHWA